jgi:hypothetical protein
MTAEFSLEQQNYVRLPSLSTNGVKLYYVKGKAAINSDYITVAGLSSVQGCILTATDGTVGTQTISTNVITVTNAGALYWSGFVWGY